MKKFTATVSVQAMDKQSARNLLLDCDDITEVTSIDDGEDIEEEDDQGEDDIFDEDEEEDEVV